VNLFMDVGDANPIDPDFASVVLLTHLNGVDGSTSFPDSSSYAHTVSSSAQIDTAQSKFGGASIEIVSGGHCLRINDHAALTLGSGAFTVQMFARFSGTGTRRWLFGQADASGSNASCNISIQRTTGDRIRAIAFSGSSVVIDITGTTAISSATWYYIAFGRTGNTFNLYVGTSGTATLDGTGSSSATLNDSSEVLGIGALGAMATDTMSGHIDEVRYTVGVYRSDIATVPTAEFPNF
jgi:hypothetical protein